MNIEQRLNQVADRYRNLGFKVILRPSTAELPAFAKDFKVEILATKEGSGILAVAKGNASELQGDKEVPRYAEITSKQPGWRLDVFVLGPDITALAEKREAQEPAEEDIRRAIDDSQRILQAGFSSQAVIAAWATLEAAMRKRLAAGGRKALFGTSPRTMLNELFSAGVFSNSEFRDLEGLFQLRNIIVHGFTVPQFQTSSVEFLLNTARQLLEGSHQAKQPA
jgi:uncharacterized protein YutE (UPF0331/DUF86 family)